MSKRIVSVVLAVLILLPFAISTGMASIFGGESGQKSDEQENYATLDDSGEAGSEQSDEDESEQWDESGPAQPLEDESEESYENEQEDPAIMRSIASLLPSREYYVSNGGDDNMDGLTPGTAWSSLNMLNNTVFNPGDAIYLDATSVWDGQLILQGSGVEGNPIILTKYNDGGDPTQRPVLNGEGTSSLERRWGLGIGADNITSGTVELINVSFWEISGLEITNLGETLAQRRCGIRILSDYASGPESRTMENYIGNKMEHIYIRDCYVHDVNSAHQAQQAPGFDDVNIAGAKGGGGIISSGFVDDLLVEGCTVMRCDSEGIRNEACGPASGSFGGIDANNGYAQAAKITFRNNFVSKCAGDAFVMSGADGGVMEYNYATLCGKSYLTDMSGNLLVNYGDSAVPQRLGTQDFSAMWFVGCANSVAQYNASINNSYESASSGTAWGIDAYCNNVVYQYNYSAGNSGGWYTHKYASINTAVRYNISVDDGMSPGFKKARDSFIMLDPLGSTCETDAPRIYNNLIILNLKEDTDFFGRNDNSAFVYFQNNIVYSKNRNTIQLVGGQNHAAHSIAGGDVTNNLFYPVGLVDLSVGRFVAPEVIVSDNLFDDPLLEDIDAIPLDVLHNLDNAAIDAVSIRNMIFDTEKLADFRLTPDSPAIDAGAPVTVASATDQRYPLTKDIFDGLIDNNNDLNIGVQQVTTVLTQSVAIMGVPQGNVISDDTFQLYATVLPENATDKSVTWRVTDENGNPTIVAVITQDGLLTTLDSGTIKVTVVTNDLSACEDSVVIDIEKTPYLRLQPGQSNPVTMTVGQTNQLQVESNTLILYISSAPSTVTVTQTGLLTGVKAGISVITVRCLWYPNLIISIVVNCTK